MKNRKSRHNRQSIRLRNYDYSKAGLYFITLCVNNHECLFGKIIQGKMVLNNAGKMVGNEWIKMSNHYPNVRLHPYVIMPNHFHAILEISVGATLVVAQNKITQNKIAQNKIAPNNKIARINEINHDNTIANNNTIAHDNAITQVKIVDRDANGVDRDDNNRATTRVAPTTKTVGNIVGAFKSIVTVKYIYGVKNYGWLKFDGKLWQRNYYEHIIRDEKSYESISDYIENNPARWVQDKFFL